MSNWIKKDKYYATNGSYTMSWNDVKNFILYFKKEFLVSGTKKECLDEFIRHDKLPESYKKP